MRIFPYYELKFVLCSVGRHPGVHVWIFEEIFICEDQDWTGDFLVELRLS